DVECFPSAISSGGHVVLPREKWMYTQLARHGLGRAIGQVMILQHFGEISSHRTQHHWHRIGTWVSAEVVYDTENLGCIPFRQGGGQLENVEIFADTDVPFDILNGYFLFFGYIEHQLFKLINYFRQVDAE